jgi:hypothetical protein
MQRSCARTDQWLAETLFARRLMVILPPKFLYADHAQQIAKSPAAVLLAFEQRREENVNHPVILTAAAPQPPDPTCQQPAASSFKYCPSH